MSLYCTISTDRSSIFVYNRRQQQETTFLVLQYLVWPRLCSGLLVTLWLTTGRWTVHRSVCCWGRLEYVAWWKHQLGRYSAGRWACPRIPAEPWERWSNVAAESSSLPHQTEQTELILTGIQSYIGINDSVKTVGYLADPGHPGYFDFGVEVIFFGHLVKEEVYFVIVSCRVSCGLLYESWADKFWVWEKKHPQTHSSNYPCGKVWGQHVWLWANVSLTAEPVDGSFSSDALLLRARCPGDVEECSQEVAGSCCVKETI